MKSLLILRHAEAAPASASVPDPLRPLTPAGAAQARRLGEAMRQRGLAFERVLCSAALRARETAEAVLAAGGYAVPLELSERLYNASGEEMAALLHDPARKEERLLLVTHMPGAAELLSWLITEQGDLGIVFQAGTLAEVALEIDRWDALEPGAGALRLLLPP
jgi:phosphohistidine phosphatase SixA